MRERFDDIEGDRYWGKRFEIVDACEVAERAGDPALGIAERYSADVHVIHAVGTTTYGFEDAPRSFVGLRKEGGRNAIEGSLQRPPSGNCR